MSNTFLYIVTVLIWGSTWLAIEYQLGVVEPEVSIVYRYLAASGVLLMWCKIKGLSLSFKVKDHIYFIFLGLLLFSLNYILAYRAQIYVTSALAAIAFSMMLWMNIVLSRVVFGTRATRQVLLGAALGIIGIVILFAPQVTAISLSDGVFFWSLLALGGLDGVLRQHGLPIRPEALVARGGDEYLEYVLRGFAHRDRGIGQWP